MNFSQFFNQYFVQGWSSPESYNIYDTSLYALLAVVIVYFSYSFLKKKGIKFSYETVLQILPLIVLGSFVRVFADAGIYPRCFWTVTPGVWIMFFTLGLITLLLDSRFNTGGKLTVSVPVFLLIPHLFFSSLVNPSALFYFLIFCSLSIIPFILLRHRFPLFNNKFNLLVLASHLFDATSSFVNVDFFNYKEIHLVAGSLSRLFNTGFVMYPLKLIVLIPVLYYLEQEEEDEVFKNYLKLIICVLGFGPGVRNLITVLLGV